jgi:hypothetical protein
VTIYCPSCGKPNTDQAEKCVSCGAELGQAKAPGPKKFKGTMMMGAPGAAPPKPGAPASPPKPATPAPGGAGAPAGSDKKNLAFQATMMGSGMTPPPGPPGAGAPPGDQPRIPGPPPPSAGPPSAGPPSPAQPEAADAAPPATAPAGPASPPEPAAAGPVAGGGFGAGAPGTPDTAAAPPAAGGWGAPPAAAPPAGGTPGWGGAPTAPGTAPAGGLGNNKKLIIGVAAGCLLLVVLACVAGIVGIFAFRNAAEQAGSAATSFAAEASRVSLGFTLNGVKMSCEAGGAEAAASFFHPKAFAQLSDQACTVSDRAIDVLANAEQSSAQVLAHTGMADRATSLGLDPDACFLYQADGAQVVGCALEDGFKIVHMDNLGSL